MFTKLSNHFSAVHSKSLMCSEFITAHYRVIQPYFQRTLLFVNNGLIQNGARKTGLPSRRPTLTLVYETAGRFSMRHPVVTCTLFIPFIKIM